MWSWAVIAERPTGSFRLSDDLVHTRHEQSARRTGTSDEIRQRVVKVMGLLEIMVRIFIKGRAIETYR